MSLSTKPAASLVPMAMPRTFPQFRSMAPARAVTSPSLATSMGMFSPSSRATSRYMVLTCLSKSSLPTFRNREATMIRLSMYTPALDTPMASTRGIWEAAVFMAWRIPS